MGSAVIPDAVIVGAGIVGCAAARALAREGASVLVVDREEPGRHASWAAAGMLAPQAEAARPGAFLDFLLRARSVFPSLAAELKEETAIDVGYRTEGMLLLALDEAARARLGERLAWQRAAGLRADELTGDEARSLEPVLTERVLAALLLPGDHQVDNRLLVRALWFSAHAAGARFATGRGVRRVEAARAGARVELEDGETIEAGSVVIAAGTWSGGIEGLPRALPVDPVHGQLVALDTSPPVLRHVVMSGHGYLVPRADGRLIVGATAERLGFDTSVTQAGLDTLVGIASEVAPDLGNRRVLAHWAGLRPGTPDGLPVLGYDPELPALVYATGHFRNGILLGPLTGEVVRDLVLQRAPEVDLTLFRPDRFGPPRAN